MTIVALFVGGCAAAPSEVERAVGRGVGFLVRSQNEDGSWGTGVRTTGFEFLAMAPGTHQSFKVATTALCVMALGEAGERQAYRKGLEYLIEHGDVRRDDGMLLPNVWAHPYVIQAMAGELRRGACPGVSRARVQGAAAWHVDRLRRYETHVGGWHYYEFNAVTQRPAMLPTSFNCAAGLVALWEAREAGIEVPEDVVERTVRRLGEMRLPHGSYLYEMGMRYWPGWGPNVPRGSLGRIQAGNLGLWVWDHAKVGEEEVVAGLELLEREGMYLNMGRKRPYPHDSWHYNAPYYYYFGYYYAGRLVERLGEKGRRFKGMVVEAVVQYQEPDGSWWDYPMWDYHKPYGTAFAVMALLRCER